MDGLDKQVLRKIEEEERDTYLAKLQAELEGKNIIPKTPRLYVNRFKHFFEYAGAFCLGCFAGTFTLLLNFIIFVYFLHLQF